MLHSKVETEHERELAGVSLSGLMIGKVCCMDEKVDNKICDVHFKNIYNEFSFHAHL